MNSRLLVSGVAAVMICAGSVSAAHAEGWYFGLPGGVTSSDIAKSDLDAAYGLAGSESSIDDSGSSWGADIGYQWGRHFAVEVGYVDLGEATYTAAAYGLETSFQSNGPTVGAVGILPLGDRFELHGRAGVLFARTRITERLVDDNGDVLAHNGIKGNSKDPFLGVGAGWNINPEYTLRVDFRRFLDVGDSDETGEADIDQLYLSIVFR